MPALINLTGKRFGRLVVLRRGYDTTQGKPSWLCICDCGTKATISGDSLRTKRTFSCGCLQRERARESAKITSRTHGMTHSPEHFTWAGMLSRCRNPNATGYERYGGVGIKVCKRWLKFENFYKDIGPRPSPTHSLDRIDKYGDYEKKNCRWSTALEQANNRRDNRMVKIDGKWVTLPNACRMFGDMIDQGGAWRRIVKFGWPHKIAVSTPPRKINRR